MKSFKTILLATIMLCSFNQAQAWDWESIKKSVSSVLGDDTDNIIDNILKTDKLEVADLAGTWRSSGPAVSFKSENLLEQAGGVAAATTIEDKLAPYYNRVGLENATFSFTKEGNVTITLKNGQQITGTVTKGETEGTMIFNFNKLSNGNLGKLTAYVSKGTSLNIMFDATKLVKFVSSIAAYTKQSTLTTVASLLNQYEGVYAGFKFDKQ